MNGLVYSILSEGDWQTFKESGVYPGQEMEGGQTVIPLATADQLREVLKARFAEHEDLVLVQVPAEPLGDDLVWELSSDGGMQPQLHGALKESDMQANWFIGDGSFLPEAVF